MSQRQVAATGSGFRSTLLATAIIGAGIMAAVDEIVFHQLLAWHHFYDWSGGTFGLLSDGLLHAASLVALVAGFFWVADLRRRAAFVPLAGGAGVLLGAGAFQVVDGLVFHKVVGLHQIRYGVHLLPYDLAWNLGGALLLLGGLALALTARWRS